MSPHSKRGEPFPFGGVALRCATNAAIAQTGAVIAGLTRNLLWFKRFRRSGRNDDLRFSSQLPVPVAFGR